ncbi:MAG TPA: type II toxin-antitoxin system HicB family antitoxin [Anaerolineae bacterium]
MSDQQSPSYEDLHAVRDELKVLRERIEQLETRLGEKGQRTYVLPILLEPDETGGYVVTSTLLPGLVTEGDTRQEAMLHAREAAEGLLEVMLEDGDDLPAELLGYQPGDPLTIVIAAPEPT